MVRGLNKVQLIGNLGRDPELRHTAQGTAVATLSLAVNRARKGANGTPDEETEWFRVVLWERLAETAGEHLLKGQSVYVEGRLQSRRYTDREGVERTAIEVIAHELLMLGGRKEEPSATVSIDDEIPF